MNKHLVTFLFCIFLISNIYTYDTNAIFCYYDEIINIGFLDIVNSDAVCAEIIIYNNNEIYFDNYYTLEEIKNVSLFVSNDLPTTININYIFYDANENIVDEKINIYNLKLHENIFDFYISYSSDCDENLKQERNEFWKDDDFFLCSKMTNINDYDFFIVIENDEKDNLKTEFQLLYENVTFPFLVPKTLDVGYEDYLISIKIIENVTNKEFFKKISFSYYDLTKSEYIENIRYIIDKNYETIDVSTNITTNTTKNYYAKEDNDFSLKTDNSNLKNKINNFYLFFFIIVFLCFLFFIYIFNNKKSKKKTTNRRQNREQK